MNSSSIDVESSIEDNDNNYDDDDDGIDIVLDGCDESKCVAKGLSYLFNDSSTCYGDEYMAPRMCSNGFLPVVVEGELVRLHKEYIYGQWFQYNVSYFTCCPPPPIIESSFYNDNATTAIVTRRCSDPIPTTTDINDFGATADSIGICDDDPDRKYPRRMKTSKGIFTQGIFDVSPSETDAFVCCDDSWPDENYIDEVDCVPYRNEVYEFKHAVSMDGLLTVVFCDFPDGSFTVPRPLKGKDITDIESTGRYQCCKNGTPAGPFVKNDSFRNTIYIPLSLWIIAAATSTLVIIALVLPIWIGFKKNAKNTGSLQSSRGDSNKRTAPKQTPSYSTYNLYVVYLALFDLIYGLKEIGFYASILDQKFNPKFQHIVAAPSNLIYPIHVFRSQDTPILYAMININMWINVIISYQILLLLQTSQSLKKIRQPSVLRINKQVGMVFLLSMVYMTLLYTLRHLAIQAGLAGEYDKVMRIAKASEIFYWAFQFIPVIFIGGITLTIWWRGYVPSVKNSKSSTQERAMRQLFYFFLRIIMVFILIWIPSMGLVQYGTVNYQPVYFLIAQSLLAIQPILSTCMVLTKFDARKYMLDMISLSYFRKTEIMEQSDVHRSKPTYISNDSKSIEISPTTRSRIKCSRDVESICYSSLDHNTIDIKNKAAENSDDSFADAEVDDETTNWRNVAEEASDDHSESLTYSILGFIIEGTNIKAAENSDENSGDKIASEQHD